MTIGDRAMLLLNEESHFQGLYSLSGKTSYRKISWSLEAARFGFKLFQSLWNLAGTSAALLPRCLSHFRAIRPWQHPISRLRDFTRFGGKTSYRLVNRGPVTWDATSRRDDAHVIVTFWGHAAWKLMKSCQVPDVRPITAALADTMTINTEPTRILWHNPKPMFGLTTLEPNKMAHMMQAILSTVFSWMKPFAFLSNAHWSLFSKVPLTTSHQ